jgi:hypothetical protein
MECNPHGDCWCKKATIITDIRRPFGCVCQLCLLERVKEKQNGQSNSIGQS